MIEVERRVKYFPSSDMAFGINIQKIETLYKSQVISITDINDALEFYNFYLYFHDKTVIGKCWSLEQVSQFAKFTDELKNQAYKYINGLDDSRLLSEFKNIESEYIDDLLKILESSKFKNISGKAVYSLLQNYSFFVYHAVLNEKFVNHYGKEICEYITANGMAELIISAEDSKNNSTVKRSFIPNCLQETSRNKIFESYIDSDNPNPNYLELLVNIPFVPKLSPLLIVKARKKLEEAQKKIISYGGKICSFRIHFEKQQKEKVLISDSNNLAIDLSYSSDWILEHLDYPSIFFNFVDMFGFVDEQFRIITTNKVSSKGLLDYISMKQNTKLYQKNILFDFFESLLNHELYAYRYILLRNKISLESVIESVFRDILPSNFNLPVITTHFSKQEITYMEKCQEIATNIDFISKQYVHITQYGNIDKELLQNDIKPTNFEDIPSLVSNKYVQGTGIVFQNLIYLLFSDQCMLNYVKRINNFYPSFCELINSEVIKKEDYPEYEQTSLKELEKWDIIEFSDDGGIHLKNLSRINILKDLYLNEYENFNRFELDLKNEIIELSKLGIVCFEDKLLSRQESAYINYYLNEKYPNGPKLRNQYAHGIGYIETDEKIHFKNYIILLRLLILLTLKIYDDVCLFRSIDEG